MNIKLIDEIIIHSIPQGLILNIDDKELILDSMDDDFDYNAGFDKIKAFLEKPFLKKSINIKFLNNGLTDEVQFDVESLYELGELWIDFMQEENVGFGSFRGRYDAPIKPLSNERLKELFTGYVLHDLESADPSYVLDTLQDELGMTTNEILAVGLESLIKEV